MSSKKVCLLTLKIAAMAVLLWFAFRKSDLSSVASRFTDIHSPWVVIGFFILMLQLIITGIRWHITSEAIGAGISRHLAIKLTLIGQFFNQVLPSSFGGDAVRAVLLSREGISVRSALISILCDRITALIMLVVIALITLPVALILDGNLILVSLRDFFVFSLSLFFCIFFFIRWKKKAINFLSRISSLQPIIVVLSNLKIILFSKETGFLIIFLSAIVQLLIVLSFYFLALALGVRLSYIHLLMLPSIILISTLPFSFAGWGIRENAMIVGLGFFGVSSVDSLALSVGFGIGQAIIGLPGLLVFMLPKNRCANY